MSVDNECDTITITNTEIKEPSMYKVVLLNDDTTSMDFVIMVLITIFNKNKDEAEELMMEVHKNGKGIAGIYTYEIATTKQQETFDLAEHFEFLDFKVTVEEV